jgi:hypothetical protein
MNAPRTVSANTVIASASGSGNRARFFYVGAATVLLVLVFLGFQHFYLHGRAYPGRELTPPIRTALILHGIAMTAWIALFMIQPLLIVSGKRRLHMALGRIGVFVAASVVFFGFQIAIGAARVNPPELQLWGLNMKQFLAIPIISMVLFAAYVGIGVWQRRRPQVHRPMMLLATLAILPAAVDRIDAIRGLYERTMLGAVFGPAVGPLALGLAFFVVHLLLTRAWDRHFATGLAALAVASAGIMQFAPTRGWDQIATWLLR